MTQHRQRKSPRLPGYDYTSEGAYFVTICTQHRLHLFGQVVDGTMHHASAGTMVVEHWRVLSNRFADVTVDCSVVMPNHTHAVIIINRADLPTAAYTALTDAVHWFKTMTTNAYIRGVREQDWESFPGKLWQRSFHDHIIRSERRLNTIREYVATNPARWEEDTFYTRLP